MGLLVFSFAITGTAQDAGQNPKGLPPIPGNPPVKFPQAPTSPPAVAAPVRTAPVPVPQVAALTTALPDGILTWDSVLKEYSAKAGDPEARFSFHFTNVSSANLVINSAAASCGCTVPKLPQLPWTNAPGAIGEIPVTMNLAGKNGVVFKTITVNTDKGAKILTVKVTFEPPVAVAAAPMDRNKNQELAKADRQAVFKGECASCHVEPTKGKVGKDLFVAACGICHEADHRATMVADLRSLNHDTNSDYWRTWISQGKPGSLMPGFANSEGGPLNDTQINSLVQYLVATIPTQPVRHAAAK